MQRLWLISYDVADDRRRRQLDKQLLALGDRVLESLFEVWLRADQVDTVSSRLRKSLSASDDTLAMIPMCRHCQRGVRHHGQGRAQSDRHTHYFHVA